MLLNLLTFVAIVLLVWSIWYFFEGLKIRKDVIKLIKNNKINKDINKYDIKKYQTKLRNYPYGSKNFRLGIEESYQRDISKKVTNLLLDLRDPKIMKSAYRELYEIDRKYGWEVMVPYLTYSIDTEREEEKESNLYEIKQFIETSPKWEIENNWRMIEIESFKRNYLVSFEIPGIVYDEIKHSKSEDENSKKDLDEEKNLYDLNMKDVNREPVAGVSIELDFSLNRKIVEDQRIPNTDRNINNKEALELAGIK